MSDQQDAKRKAILEEIGSIIIRTTQRQSSHHTIHNVTLLNYQQPKYSSHCFESPLASLTVHGHKIIHAGPYELATQPGALLVTCVDMPSSSVIQNASPDNPYLGIFINLDRKILADILTELPMPGHIASEQGKSAWIMEADNTFLDAYLRLAKLLASPQHIHILLPLILRELHYLILISPNGSLLHNLYMCGARDNRIIDVIAWLKQNIAAPVAMESLAQMAHMSISSFHRHFKSITGFSPLQYHKKLRLHEAQRLMLAENRRVTEAAAEVGYESITQFNREYRRLFGQPPGRNVSTLKKKLDG